MPILFLMACCVCSAPDQAAAAALPAVETLPDPFLFQDGRRVRTLADWEARRQEMKALLLEYEYGRMPGAPGNVRVEKVSPPEILHDGLTQRYLVRLSMGPDQSIEFGARLFLPAQGAGPFPAVVRIGLGDEAVPAMNRRGYAFACFDINELDPDTEGYDEAGPAQKAYPEYDWGGLATWAWGASRVADYLVTRPDIHAGQLIVTGHSRTGKAALLAGAMDERFALTVPNGSGCGGAAAFRIYGPNCETLAMIASPKRFSAWFQKDFRQFSDLESHLPFDQHFMRALTAPRAVLTTDALEDRWANLLGAQAACQGAQPVFDFLGVSGRNMSHFRPGKHDQLPEDFEALLDAADELFRGKKPDRDLHAAYDAEFKTPLPWKAEAPARPE